MKSLIRIDNVSYNYSTSPDTLILKDISLQINDGEFVAIVGPRGCGKSTLLSLIAGLLNPTEGNIYTTDNNIINTEKNIGYTLQKEHLFNFRNKDVFNELEVRNKLIDNSDIIIRQSQGTYGLVAFKNHMNKEITHMMKQRAALICTLLKETDILLLDEPFSAFDFQAGLEVSHDIYNTIRNENKTAILVTRSLSEAISIADKVIVLTKSPGTIKHIFNINLSEKIPFKALNSQEFKGYFDILCKEIENNEAL